MSTAALQFEDTVDLDAPENKETTSMTSAPRKGRPRSEKSRNAIIKATNNLLIHKSVQELSIEAIAKKAKVGKTTIYRWWPNKTAVVMDALIAQPGIQSPLPTPKNNAEAVIMQLDKLIRLLTSKNGETIAQLFSEAQADPKAQKIFADTFLSPLIDAIEFSIQQGIKKREFRASLESRMAVDMMCGPIFFRLLSRPDDLDDDFRENYPKEAVRLISA
ncbi:MAG: TetR family transcriptional regulator [Micavibrio sp.]|nr:TetR family transcriptional regulator [Micavibrio sp.]|tara:strand:+ start:422 stop:1075 length:654 start_codon:yes stop_codon:yes gene_type:complete